MTKALRSKGGFTYIGALVMVMIVGIMATRASVVWSTAMRREREDELISRGTQIRDALRLWYKVRVSNGKLVPLLVPAAANAPLPQVQGPTELASLLKDPNTAANAHYLRPYCLVDPITGKEWDVIRKDGKIVGVKSTSALEPIKQGNFPFDLHPEDFEKKSKYSEWQFIYDRVPPVTTGGTIQGVNQSSPPGASAPPVPETTSGTPAATPAAAGTAAP